MDSYKAMGLSNESGFGLDGRSLGHGEDNMGTLKHNALKGKVLSAYIWFRKNKDKGPFLSIVDRFPAKFSKFGTL